MIATLFGFCRVFGYFFGDRALGIEFDDVFVFICTLLYLLRNASKYCLSMKCLGWN